MEKTDEGRKLSAEIRANLSVRFEQLSARSPTKWTNQQQKKSFYSPLNVKRQHRQRFIKATVHYPEAP